MGVYFFKGKICYFTKKMMIPVTFYPAVGVFKAIIRYHVNAHTIYSIMKSTFFYHFVGNEPLCIILSSNRKFL